MKLFQSVSVDRVLRSSLFRPFRRWQRIPQYSENLQCAFVLGSNRRYHCARVLCEKEGMFGLTILIQNTHTHARTTTPCKPPFCFQTGTQVWATASNDSDGGTKWQRLHLHQLQKFWVWPKMGVPKREPGTRYAWEVILLHWRKRSDAWC